MPKVLRTLPERGFRRRARAVAVLFCAVCLRLAVRLFFLQVPTDGFYADRAQGQPLRDTVVPADRGRIYSCLLYTSDGEPKYDIRDWSPDGTRMGKGISLSHDELAIQMCIRDRHWPPPPAAP